MTKVRLLKDLPGIKAGTEIDGNSLNIFIHEKNNFSLDFIEKYPDFFEILEDNPVWADEEWEFNSRECFLEMGDAHIASLSVQVYKRADLIAAAPEMWRLLKEVANGGGSASWRAAELLNKIGK